MRGEPHSYGINKSKEEAVIVEVVVEVGRVPLLYKADPVRGVPGRVYSNSDLCEYITTRDVF